MVNAQPIRVKGPGTPGNAHATPYLYVKVLTVDQVNKAAHIRDQVGGQRIVSTTRRIGRTPLAGENWLITSIFGDWTFIVCINPAADAGTTAQRPVAYVVGQQYFDTTLNKPIWRGNAGWVDATGTAV